MAKDLDRRGQRGLVPYTGTRSDEDRDFFISPLTKYFLQTVFGTDRFTRLAESHIGLTDALRRLRSAQIRSKNIEQEMKEILANESLERGDVKVTFEHKTARTALEIDLLSTEKVRRTQEHLTETARLMAEAREHDQKAQPAVPRKASDPQRDMASAERKQAYNHAWQDLETRIEIQKIHNAVDEQVAAGLFKETVGAKIKDEMEQLIFARIGGKK